MRTILGFPHRYEVYKKLGKERFLKLGNLSPAEKRRIEAYLDGIEIIYNIPLRDCSEMMILVANCPAPTEYSDIHKQYGLLNFANAIAASLPYECLLIVRAERAVKLFAFSKHDHQNNMARSVVDDTYSTPDIYLSELTYRERDMFSSMANIIGLAENADDLNKRWISILAGYSGGYPQSIGCAYEPFHAYQYQRLLDNDVRRGVEERIVDGCLGSDYSDIVDAEDDANESWLSKRNCSDKSDLYEGYALDPDGDAIHRTFLEFCCEVCRTVYLLSTMESNIKADRTELDLLFGCLLDWGLSLSEKFAMFQIDSINVYAYGMTSEEYHDYKDHMVTYQDGIQVIDCQPEKLNAPLIACFAENVPETVIKRIAKMQPLRAVFRDSCFADSPSKINVYEIFKMLAPDTRVKVI